MAETRLHFQEELAQLERKTLAGMDIVVETIDRTLEAVGGRDAELATLIVTDDDRLDARYLEVHQGILYLLARQAPVATDLRLVAALLHVIVTVERMGDQCVNIAKLIPLSGRNAPIDRELVAKIGEMGHQVRSQVVQAKRAFAEREVGLAEDLARQDDLVDQLNRECFRRALELGDEADAREWAMYMMLVARALERIGDYAVDVGEQAAFVVTGLFREFTDASHPDSLAGGPVTPPPS